MKTSLIVCIDDDRAVVDAVGRCLRREPSLEVRVTTDATQALAWITDDPVAVLVADYDMPELTGAQLAGRAKQIRPETVRILLTGQRSLEAAIDGIHQGEIFRFINKPFEDLALRRAVLDATVRHEELSALAGDRQRHARRETLRAALEAEFPGISKVDRTGGVIEVSADPWTDARALGLLGMGPHLEH